jgi:hypothetical protein
MSSPTLRPSWRTTVPVGHLEQQHELAPFFSRFLREAYDILSDYSHVGMLQVGRWIGEDEIAPKHTDEEMAELLRLADQLALVCAVFVTDICKKNELVVQDKLKAYFASAPLAG